MPLDFEAGFGDEHLARIMDIVRRERSASPEPWQRSYFVDTHATRSLVERDFSRAQENLIIRGPGRVGDANCNQVLRFQSGAGVNASADIDFTAHARADVPWLLQRLSEAYAEIGRLKGTVNSLTCTVWEKPGSIRAGAKPRRCVRPRFHGGHHNTFPDPECRCVGAEPEADGFCPVIDHNKEE